jgi:Fe-S cluster biogenesis protein NfuA
LIRASIPTPAAQAAFESVAAPVAAAGSTAHAGVRCAPGARRRLADILAAREGPPQAVWVRREASGEFGLVLVDRADVGGVGWLRHDGDVPLAWRAEDAEPLTAALVDHRDGGFEVRTAETDPEQFAGEVRRVLEEGVNPLVASHGGRILLVEAGDGVARVRMEGGCQGCTAARETLAGVVERHLLHAVPGLCEVVDVTDHAAGDAPWYAPAREGVIALPVLPQGLREACR